MALWFIGIIINEREVAMSDFISIGGNELGATVSINVAHIVTITEIDYNAADIQLSTGETVHCKETLFYLMYKIRESMKERNDLAIKVMQVMS